MSNEGLRVYDFRKDIQNVLVTPQIRARFMQMEPGTVQTRGHSHDLGQEVFLCLQGSAVFEIAGKSAEVHPGQMVVALTDEIHKIRVTSEEPFIQYLSVTPHIQPTHTMWDEDGKRMPHRFVPSSSYDVETDTTTPTEELIDCVVDTVAAFAGAAQSTADEEKELGAILKKALTDNDDTTAGDTRARMWDALLPLYEKMYEIASLWNDLAPRAANTEQ